MASLSLTTRYLRQMLLYLMSLEVNLMRVNHIARAFKDHNQCNAQCQLHARVAEQKG
jgi:hypothetical protein